MDRNKLLKAISGICIGLGIGMCFGVALGKVWMGLLFGIGIGLCYSTAFLAIGAKDQKNESADKTGDENNVNDTDK